MRGAVDFVSDDLHEPAAARHTSVARLGTVNGDTCPITPVQIASDTIFADGEAQHKGVVAGVVDGCL